MVILVACLYFCFHSHQDQTCLHFTNLFLSGDNIICIAEALKSHRLGPQPHCARSCTNRAELPIHQKERSQYKARILMQTDVGVQGK